MSTSRTQAKIENSDLQSGNGRQRFCSKLTRPYQLERLQLKSWQPPDKNVLKYSYHAPLCTMTRAHLNVDSVSPKVMWTPFKVRLIRHEITAPTWCGVVIYCLNNNNTSPNNRELQFRLLCEQCTTMTCTPQTTSSNFVNISLPVGVTVKVWFKMVGWRYGIIFSLMKVSFGMRSAHGQNSRQTATVVV